MSDRTRLSIDWQDLETAFEDASDEFGEFTEHTHYFDLQTGQVVAMHDDIRCYPPLCRRRTRYAAHHSCHMVRKAASKPRVKECASRKFSRILFRISLRNMASRSMFPANSIANSM